MRLNSLLLSAAIAVAAPALALAQSAPLSTAPEAAPAAAAAALSAPAVTAQTTPTVAPAPHLVANGNLVATLKASPDFTILAKALDATNMSSVLSTTPGLTLFAPTDAAFKALPPAELAALLAPKNTALLQQVLTYHLVHLDLDTAKFKGARGPVQSVERQNLQLDGSGTTPKVNDADIIEPDVRASNGLIQVVDKVLIPSDVTLPKETVSSAATPAPNGG